MKKCRIIPMVEVRRVKLYNVIPYSRNYEKTVRDKVESFGYTCCEKGCLKKLFWTTFVETAVYGWTLRRRISAFLRQFLGIAELSPSLVPVSP